MFQLKARDMRRARAGYYGLIDQIDAQITRLAYHLWRSLLVRNTIFAFVADHGEMLGDHHWWAKSVGYEGSIRVPFVLSFPNGDAPADRRPLSRDHGRAGRPDAHRAGRLRPAHSRSAATARR